jgi:hypothetical protein
VRSEQEIEADRLAAEQAEKLKKQQAAQSKREGLAGTSGRAEALLTDKVLDLEMRKQKNEIEDKEFNAEVEKLRKEAVVVRAVTAAIRPTQEEYQELVNKAETATEQKSLQEKGTKIMEQQARDVYDRFNIPELIEIASKAKEVVAPSVTPAPKAAPNETTAAAPNPEREKAAKLTVARMKEILKAQGVTVPKNAKKDQLLDLLVPSTKPEQVNDAIAPSEVYLSAYEETRNKYRRVS